jgi:ring-1,2-phenylacetyl-CoA epoxidase subunit PaaD
MANSTEANVNKAHILELLKTVFDPEIPTLSIVDLGILREVLCGDNYLKVIITPTYSGCPAMETIELDIIKTLDVAGYKDVKVAIQLAPPWTTNWISDHGRMKLLEEGIAPPLDRVNDRDRGIECPRCTSVDVSLLSLFGSTACKSLYRCESCLDPFDYFKCH